jgi:hypothetical protein
MCRLRFVGGNGGLPPAEGGGLKRSAINNSLLDLVENTSHVIGYPGYQQDKPLRRGSVGSLGRLTACHVIRYPGYQQDKPLRRGSVGSLGRLTACHVIRYPGYQQD